MDPETLHSNIRVLSQSNLSAQGFPKDLLADRSGRLTVCNSLAQRSKRTMLRLLLLHRKRLRAALRATRDGLEELTSIAAQILDNTPPTPTRVLRWRKDSDALTQCLQVIEEVQAFHQLQLASSAEARFKATSRWAKIGSPDLWEVFQTVSGEDLLKRLRTLQQSLGLVSDSEETQSPLQRVQELLAAKDAIIETLQEQLEQKAEVVPETPPAHPPETRPLAAPETDDHELHLQGNRIAQDVESLLRIIEEMEKGQHAHKETLPAPLSLARDMELRASGRKPQRNLDECHSSLQEAIQRLTDIQEVWVETKTRLQELEQQIESNQPIRSGQGWLELGEEEVRELEQSMARLQARFERLKNENEELKQRLNDAGEP